MNVFRTASCRAARAAVPALSFLLVPPLLPASPLMAQPAATPPAPGIEITITPDRVPTDIQRTGSAITILRGEDLRRSSPTSLVDALRSVPGLDITESGGPGASGVIRLRGANAGQTLVLIDGVRVNDPSSGSGEFDTSMIAPALIDRIEVLRGPQSALYGSDAVGGVVNIITKRLQRGRTYSLSLEGGSYGSFSGVGTAAGGAGDWTYATSGLGQVSNGFSRYGYRIGRLTPASGSFEPDGYDRLAGFAKLGYDPGTGFRFDLSAIGNKLRTEYDAAFGPTPDSASQARQVFSQVAAKAELDTFDRMVTHAFQVFANKTDRKYFDVNPGFFFSAKSQFTGTRVGGEHQSTIRLAAFGSVILGARFERESVTSYNTDFEPFPSNRTKTLGADQDTKALFALWQLPVGERLTLSLGGRYDKVTRVEAFPTWRATLAYNIFETGTKLRASAGTGAKAPTLFQLYSPDYGTATLQSERSRGFDAGIDQAILNGRAKLSLTVFRNRIDNLIDFATSPACRPAQAFGCYLNIARATTSGVEASLDATLLEEYLRLRAAYTYLHAKDRITNLTLARRPQHIGRIGLQITPYAGLMIEPSVTMVSERFSGIGEVNRLAPYARFDVHAEYAINATYKVHGRIENLTNARYQEVYNYGTTGRAYYAGMSATW